MTRYHCSSRKTIDCCIKVFVTKFRYIPGPNCADLVSVGKKASNNLEVLNKKKTRHSEIWAKENNLPI